MQLLKSLICFQGFDNGRRFLIISVVCYLLVLVLNSMTAKLIFLIILLPFLASASVRRVRDAGFRMPLAVIPILSFIICVLGITSVENVVVRWILLILSLVITIAIAMLSNARVRRTQEHILGYAGPVDLRLNEQESVNRHARVEPTLDSGADVTLLRQSNTIERLANEPTADNFRQTHRQKASSFDSLIESIKAWVIPNIKLVILVAAGIILISLLLIWFGGSESSEDKPKLANETTQTVKQRKHKIEMPDSFWLMLDQNDGLTIAWEGDIIDDQILWSADTETNNKECMQIQFNNQDAFRVIQVEVKGQGDYYADFSPLDTQVIIQAIAKKSQFKLCGYSFSLKGTQAILRTHKKYSSYFKN